MTSSGPRRLARAWRAGTLAVAMTGCLPIPYTARISPEFAGAFHRADGTPVRGMQLTVSTARADNACARPIVRATTDERGAFVLPPATERERWFILNADMNWHWFVVCAGSSDSTMQQVAGSMSFSARSPEPLDCFEWVWLGRSRVNCTMGRDRTATAGAHWFDGSVRGGYRVIEAHDDSAGGRPGVFVEWIAPSAGDNAGAVIALSRLPCGGNGCSVQQVRIAGTDSLLYIDVVDYASRAGGSRERTFRPNAPGWVAEMVHP